MLQLENLRRQITPPATALDGETVTPHEAESNNEIPPRVPADRVNTQGIANNGPVDPGAPVDPGDAVEPGDPDETVDPDDPVDRHVATLYSEDPHAGDPERRVELRREVGTATPLGFELNNQNPTPASIDGFNPQERLNNRLERAEDPEDPRIATAHPENPHANNIERRAEPRRNTQEETAFPPLEEEITGVASGPQQSTLRETLGEDEIDDEEERTVEGGDSNNAAKLKHNGNSTADNDSRAHPPFSRRAKMRVRRLFPRSGRWSKRDAGRSEEM